jgi:hypothetical protein
MSWWLRVAVAADQRLLLVMQRAAAEPGAFDTSLEYRLLPDK